jgi:hypothetical protein
MGKNLLIFRADGLVEDTSGKVLFVPLDQFKARIVNPDMCFICGALRRSTPFNDEHILPDWVLREYGLHSRKITLPNQTDFTYGQYKIPCCKRCNEAMALEFETPLSTVIKNGYQAFAQYSLSPQGMRKIFNWLSLIFFKTHLKDLSLRWNRDSRDGDLSSIGSACDIESLHHIYCVARSFYSRSEWSEGVIGSVCILECLEETSPEANFDYSDLSFSKSLLLRLGSVAVIAVLDDGGAGEAFVRKHVDRIDGPLTYLQVREVFARYSSIPPLLKEKARFRTNFNTESGVVRIEALLPTLFETGRDEGNLQGRLRYQLCRDGLIGAPNRSFIEDELMQNRRSFLFDSEGRFINHQKSLFGE